MPDNELSEREREILRLVATGASNKEVAQKLSISTNTVKVHLRNIFAKIGVVSRTEATLYAIRAGLVQVAEQSPGEGLAVPSLSVEPPTVTTPLPTLETDQSRQTPHRHWISLATVGAIVLIALVGLVGLTRQPSIIVTASPEAPPAPPRWQSHSAIPTARSGLAAAVYQNQIYSIGGETGKGVTGVVERYDPASDSWTALSALPTAAADISAAVLGGRIYVPGGRLASDASLATDQLEVYDPRQDTWETRAKLPEPVSAYALTTFEGKLYLFGGWDGTHFLDSVYQYDPGDDSWRTLTPMPRPRAYGAAAVVGGNIFVLGGYDGKDALASNDVYLPEREGGSDTPWIAGTPLPAGRYAMGVASISDNVFVIGGITGSDVTLPPLEYVPQTGKWLVFDSPSPKQWKGMAVVSEGMFIYAIGGTIDEVPETRNMAYQALYTIFVPNIR